MPTWTRPNTDMIIRTCLAFSAIALLTACITDPKGKGATALDRCAEALHPSPAKILAKANGLVFRFGGHGDSLFWRNDSLTHVWRDGKTEAHPQEFDDGYQVPGAPYYWLWGTGKSMRVCHWDGSRTVIWDHPPGDFDGIRFEGNRATWNEWIGAGSRIWIWEGANAPIRLETRHAGAGAAILTPRGATWTESDGGSTIYLQTMEDGVIREEAIEVGTEYRLALTDTLLAWVQDGHIKVHRNGETKTVSDQVDYNTYPKARGSRVAWSVDDADRRPSIWYYDGNAPRVAKRYGAGALVREVLFNGKGMLMRVWRDNTEILDEDWFDGKTVHSLGNLGLEEIRLTERRAYGMLRIDIAKAGGDCSDKNGYAGLFLGSDL